MSVKQFKFVSPGVFINEIDNSQIPKTAPEIGPVIVGRASRGVAMEPVRVESYSQFVEEFGDTVAGGGNGDVYRDGNQQSPIYGIYAAKAFLNQNVYFKGGRSLEGIAILGNGGYSKAVQTAIRDVGHDEYTIITRSNWDIIKGLKECLIYNCTPIDVTDIIHESNKFINCAILVFSFCTS